MEHSVQGKIEIAERIAPGTPYCRNCRVVISHPEGRDEHCPASPWPDHRHDWFNPNASLSAETSAGRFVDDKISDVIRMTIATCGIVMESDGVDSAIIARMRDRCLRMLGVKERRN